MRRQISETNRHRKLEQEGAGRELRELDAEWLALTKKCQEISLSCLEIEYEIQKLKEQKATTAAAGYALGPYARVQPKG